MSKHLPSIVEIVEKRIDAGIAQAAESELYYKGDLVDEDYDDETKRDLLDELELAKQKTVRPAYFSIMFTPGIPLGAASRISAKLAAFIAKEIGYPAHVSDPFDSDADWLTPSPVKPDAT
jgi:hypothetical protein